MVLVAGCFPENERPRESVSPRVHYSAAGKPVGVTLPPGQGQRADGNRFSLVRELVAGVGAPFGIQGAADLLEMKLVRELEVEASPELGGADRAMVRVTQGHAGVEVLGGELTLTFLDNRLHQITGTPLSRVRVEPAIDRLLEQGVRDVSALEAALGPGCHARSSERPSYDPEHERLVRVVDCAELTHVVDVHDGAVISSTSRIRHFAPHQGGVSVRTVADGSTDAATAWFRSATANPGTSLRNGVLVDSEPRPGSPGNCNYRLTYNGDPSVFPFATFHDSDLGQLGLSGSCSAGGSAFTQTADPNFEWQVAMDKIVMAARHAIWQQGLKLFASHWPAETSRLDVVVSDDDPNACGGAYGSYDPATREICLAAGLSGYNHWRAPIHEYGHYVQDMYDFDEYTTCEEKALAEGLADALAVSFEHFRYNPLPTLNAAQTDQLFVRGPGNGIRACDLFGDCSTVAPTTDLIIANKPCAGAPYHEGLVLSQILWNLVNNRQCTGSNCSSPQPILTSSTDETMAAIARDALTWTIVTSGSNPERVEFLERWEDCMLQIYAGYFDQAAASRLTGVFDRHFAPICPDSGDVCCEFDDRECGYCVTPPQVCF